MQKINLTPEFKKTIPWRLVVIFLLFSIAIILGGISFYKLQRDRIFIENQNSLTAISILKIGQIEQWRKERLGNAATFSSNGPLIRSIKQYFDDENQPEIRGYLLKWIVVTILLILINASIFGFFLWNQRVKTYQIRLRGETAIRELENKFNTAFRMGPVSITISTMSDNKFIDITNTFLHDMEYTREEVIGRTAHELNIWADEEERSWVIAELKEKEKIFGKVLSFKTKSGKVIYGLSSMAIVMVNGQPCNLSTVVNITEQKLAEAEIRLQSEILSHMAEAVYLVKMKDGIIVFANSKFESMFGYEEGEMIGKHVSIVNAPTEKSPEETAREIMSSLAEKGLWTGEVLNIKKDGANFWTHANVTIFDHSQFGEVLISVQNDITERKIAESQITQLNEELEQRVIQRTEQLEAVNKELEAFSYSVSHDLRAPLRSVHGYTKILLEEYQNKLDDEGKRICNIITSSATQMGGLIDDLLSFSRIGRSNLNPLSIDMKKMVRLLFEGMTSPSEREKIVITIGKLQKSYGDVALIGQVWINLLSNAIKYSSKKEVSEISIGSEVKGGMVTYFVKDNGVGFDMEYAHKLFGVFLRLHSEREFEGNGVGLAIVQRIILKHNGKVWAEGEVGKGATFYFSLPIQDRKTIRQ